METESHSLASNAPTRSLRVVTTQLHREFPHCDSMSFAWAWCARKFAQRVELAWLSSRQPWCGCVCVLVFLLSFLRGTCSSTV